MANSMDMEFDLKDFDLREISRFVLRIEARLSKCYLLIPISLSLSLVIYTFLISSCYFLPGYMRLNLQNRFSREGN